MKVIDPHNPFRGKNTRKTSCQGPYSRKDGGYARCRKIATCEGCFHHWLRHWEMRLGAEMFTSFTAFFVTLTFRDENLHLAGVDGHKVFRQYIQNLRSYGYQVRYVASYELGDKTNRPHYHAILCFGREGKKPEMPLNVRADLPHWTHGTSRYELPKTKAGTVQYTLGYVAKGGGEVLHPSQGVGKRFLLNYAEMLGRNKRALVHQFGRSKVIKVRVPGLIVSQKGRAETGSSRVYDLALSHHFTGPMVERYLAAYRDKFGIDAPHYCVDGIGGDW